MCTFIASKEGKEKVFKILTDDMEIFKNKKNKFVFSVFIPYLCTIRKGKRNPNLDLHNKAVLIE